MALGSPSSLPWSSPAGCPGGRRGVGNMRLSVPVPAVTQHSPPPGPRPVRSCCDTPCTTACPSTPTRTPGMNEAPPRRPMPREPPAPGTPALIKRQGWIPPSCPRSCQCPCYSRALTGPYVASVATGGCGGASMALSAGCCAGTGCCGVESVVCTWVLSPPWTRCAWGAQLQTAPPPRSATSGRLGALCRRAPPAAG